MLGPEFAIGRAMTIDQITRFPLKGFYGQDLDQAEVRLTGLVGDRRFGIYHPSRVKNRSPAGWSPKVNFLQMVFEAFLGVYETCFDAAGEKVTLRVAGETYGPYDLTSQGGRTALTTQIRAFGDLEDEGPLEIVEGLEQSLTDRANPCITLANPASLADLEARLGRKLGRTRFRMNAWFAALPAWAEHDLVGKTLRLGSAEVTVLEPVDRCRAINLSPGTRAWNPEDINLAMKRLYGHNNLGLLCQPKVAGTFKIGDSVEVIERP